MKKGLILLLFPMLMLTGCSSSGIRCKMITIQQEDRTIFSGSYAYSPVYVVEYTNDNGAKLFGGLKSKITTDQSAIELRLIKEDKDSFSTYKFSREVGIIKHSSNIYLDMNNHRVDTCLSYEKFTKDDNASDEIIKKSNEAYSCLKKNFYNISFSYTPGTAFINLYEREALTVFENHTYFVYSDPVSITYTEYKA